MENEENKDKKYQHQKDLNGCGIACLANLLDIEYDIVKKDFEKKFYKINRGVNIADMVRYLETRGLKYKSKFFNRRNFDKDEANKYSRLNNSITLIVKSEKYPAGHYLLRVEDGWVDPWYNLPSIDNVYAGVRKKLPNDPWYVLYQI